MGLDRIFNPKTIAVIGASDQEGSVGRALMENLLENEYGGIVYPVNNRHRSVHSIKAHNSVLDINDKIDLAVIATPPATVPGIVEECGRAKIGGAVIITAGFMEVRGEEKVAEKMLALARKHNLRLLGPNCLGFIRPRLHLNASFASKTALSGKIAFISQSGALCTAILDWSVKNNVGFSYFVSIGSMIDVGFHDLIDYFGSDKEVASILIYMESLAQARRFMSAARAFSRNKPIIVLKAGRSSEGARAAKSHTGSLAGDDAVFDAAFERAGIVRVNTTVGLFHAAKALAMQPRPAGNRMVVVTNAGGPGVIAADTLMRGGGNLAKLDAGIMEQFDKILPPAWSRGNPVDILGDADPKRYKRALEICLNNRNTDAILVILTPQAMTNPTAVAKELVAVAQKKAAGLNKSPMEGKTIMASWMGGDDVAEGRKILEKGNIPVYRQPEDAIRSFLNICRYARNLELLYETPATIPHAFNPQTEKNKRLIAEVVSRRRSTLTEIEAKELLANYGIPVAEHALARNAREAALRAERLGFPVVMKVLSPDITHKSDIGGVRLNINSREEAVSAFGSIIRAARGYYPRAEIEGVFIEPMIKKRYELIIGCKRDSQFGPVIVFGLGGVAVEIFKDTTIGLPPLNMALAGQMMKNTKIFKLLRGYRGMAGVDLSSIQFLLYKFAYLISDFPEIKELDINPFAVDEHGGIVFDAKAVLDMRIAGKKIIPYSHLVISPYPKEYIIDFKLKGGRKALLRPVKPEDEPMMEKLFKTFSSETRRHQFFGAIKNIDHDLLQRFTQIDYDREIILAAEIKERGREKLIGLARLIADPDNETAEFAVVVADRWQRRGLGNKFMDYTMDIARRRAIGKIQAEFLRDNKVIVHMFKKRKFHLEFKGRTGYAELKIKL